MEKKFKTRLKQGLITLIVILPPLIGFYLEFKGPGMFGTVAVAIVLARFLRSRIDLMCIVTVLLVAVWSIAVGYNPAGAIAIIFIGLIVFFVSKNYKKQLNLGK